MTSLLVLRKPTYPQSFMLIYGFLFELWVLNLNKEKEEEEKKMKNSAHHSPIHHDGGIPIYKALLCFVIIITCSSLDSTGFDLSGGVKIKA